MDINIIAIKEAFDWFLIRACLSVLVALFISIAVIQLYRFSSRLRAMAKRFGWPAVVFFLICSAWATYTAFPTQEEKQEYLNTQKQEELINSTWGGVFVSTDCPQNGIEAPSLSDMNNHNENSADANNDDSNSQTANEGLSGIGNAQNDSFDVEELSADDFSRGFVLTRVGTNEVHDFSAPTNAIVHSDWRRYGAAEDWFYLAFEDWSFRVGTNNIDALTMFSYGEIRSRNLSENNVFAPLRAVLGIVPEANWELLNDDSRPSQFWYQITDVNTLLLTWQNVLLNRSTDSPISFQMEIWTNGRFSYRYDFSRLNYSTISNLTVGACADTNGWWRDSVPVETTSLHFHPIPHNAIPGSDLDGDGLLIEHELFVHFTDPSNPDTDEDCLNDADEIAKGTDPWNPDSDGDGLLDGEEITLQTNPLSVDSDNDGINDSEEVQVYGTSPIHSDTDGDGLSDESEIGGRTNPTKADSDEDGLNDALELQGGTDPLDADADGDGALDGWEAENGSDPFVVDTDSDGLADGVECRIGSSPTQQDTDGDGFSDADEFQRFGTSPILSDSDEDGLSDWNETDVLEIMSSNIGSYVDCENSTNIFEAIGASSIDDSIKTMELPFLLEMCDTGFNKISIDTNGKLHLIPTNGMQITSSDYRNAPPSDISKNGNDVMIAPYWDDLALYGECCSRISVMADVATTNLTVDFVNICKRGQCDTNSMITFQVILSSDTNFPIRINYYMTSLGLNGASATIGVFNRRVGTKSGDSCQSLIWGYEKENSVTNSLSLGFRFGVGTSPIRSDTDGDGLCDGDEFTYGTNPLNPDTDEDGLDDGAEIEAGADPFKSDTDGDGMPDAWEVRYGLNPNYKYDASTSKDSDGLSNLKEYQLGSSPILNDSDGDGLSDYVENSNGTSLILLDTDGDGLDDKDEYQRGTSGINADSDRDGLNDGWEVKWSFNPRNSGSNDGNNDTDGDGLTNIEEQSLGTSPRVKDTDGDGLDDGEEVGCYRNRYASENDWASVSNGWTSLSLDVDEEMKFYYLDIYGDNDSLTIRGETIYDVICQWNGILLVGSDFHYPEDVVTTSPISLDGSFLSDAALLIAPYWTQQLSDTPKPTISAFRSGSNGNVKYAVQYCDLNAGDTNVVSFQATMIFTNGVYKSTEIIYGEETSDGVYGYNASIGVQDRIRSSKMNIGYNQYVPPYAYRVHQVIQGTGTDPNNAITDSDGDGLSDELELSIGTNPRQPDTDGDGMHDGWEYNNDFNPRVNNDDETVDSDNTNDSDFDADEDGLDNQEEADYGTNPRNDDSDGDGVSDGQEVENSSDPSDATDGGAPASRVPVAFNFGDPSGSHSEKYRLTLKPIKKPNGTAPSSDEEPKSFEWVNAEYGECETKTAMLLRGWTYEVRMYHAGTDPEYESSPDYDYSLSCIPPSCIGVVTNDPSGLFNSFDDTSDYFSGEGKVAEVLILDGGIVGDYDRKDNFTSYDLSRVYRNKPLRHWINDDDDEGDITEDNRDVPGWGNPSWVSHIRDVYRDIRIPDYHNDDVDGLSDVLDFTPVWIDMGRALNQLDDIGKSVELTLSNSDGAINVVWTSLEKGSVGDFLTTDLNGCGDNLSSNLRSAKTVQITKEETPLPKKFIAAMRENTNKGIILLEGRAAENKQITTSPLVLRAYQKPRTEESVPLFELKLPLSISPVEDMFRWIDERWVCGDTNCVPTRVGEPSNYPDSECDNKHYIFVHGYAVSVQSARGWAAEMFKRLRQSGSNSRFTAVDWRGDDTRGAVGVPGLTDEAPNYYINVEHAFATASRFVDDCAALNGRKIILAHSLGNMLVSSAAKDHGLVYDKYYMLNAAVPMEAYDEDAFSVAMIDHDWRGVTNKVYSSEWWRLFNPEDGRRRFTWRERFSGIANAINCYSQSEDTLGNVQENHWLSGKLYRGNFWAMQEVLKGTKYAEHTPEDWQMNSEGGWGYNDYYATNRNYVTWPNRRMTERFRNRIKKLSHDDIVIHPVFKPFLENWLFTTNDIPQELVTPIRSRILADAIPALSLAAGANPLNSGVKGNVNYNSCMSGKWPRDENEWWHSDIKNIAFRFNNKFFKKLVDEEEE